MQSEYKRNTRAQKQQALGVDATRSIERFVETLIGDKLFACKLHRTIMHHIFCLIVPLSLEWLSKVHIGAL